jgi:hypothetical protein
VAAFLGMSRPPRIRRVAPSIACPIAPFDCAFLCRLLCPRQAREEVTQVAWQRKKRRADFA